MFGNTIRRVRQTKGLTQIEMAELANIHANYVSEVERGLRNVSLVNILWIARALDIEPSELFVDLGKASFRRMPPKSLARLRPDKEK